MRTATLVLVCLACVGYGHRMQGSPHERSGRALTRLLLAQSDPTAAWQAAAHPRTRSPRVTSHRAAVSMRTEPEAPPRLSRRSTFALPLLFAAAASPMSVSALSNTFGAANASFAACSKICKNPSSCSCANPRDYIEPPNVPVKVDLNSLQAMKDLQEADKVDREMRGLSASEAGKLPNSPWIRSTGSYKPLEADQTPYLTQQRTEQYIKYLDTTYAGDRMICDTVYSYGRSVWECQKRKFDLLVDRLTAIREKELGIQFNARDKFELQEVLRKGFCYNEGVLGPADCYPVTDKTVGLPG